MKKHNNDPTHIEEKQAKSIRDKLSAQKQNKVDEERHEESTELTKKGIRCTKKGIILTVIGIIITIIGILLVT